MFMVPRSAPIHSATFWLNAFIPSDLFDATTRLADGEYRGLSILSKTPHYLTDQRSFSNEPRASSRMHSMAKINLAQGRPTLSQFHKCNELVECDLSGDVLRRRRASTSSMRFVLTAEPNITLSMDCRYIDSVTPAHGIGQIEYHGTIEIDPVARVIDIDLMICLFPAFEGYASVDGGPAVILFRHAPPPGILSLGPPLGAKRRIRSRLDDAHDLHPSTQLAQGDDE